MLHSIVLQIQKLLVKVKRISSKRNRAGLAICGSLTRRCMAVAVLIDATIVRGVPLPASMKLLGDWNWYLPSWLGWLPRVGREPEVEGARAWGPRTRRNRGAFPRRRPLIGGSLGSSPRTRGVMKAGTGRNARGGRGMRRALAVMIATATVATGVLAVVPAANAATLYSNLGGNPPGNFGRQIEETTQRLAQPFVPTASGTPRIAGFYGFSYLNASASVSISIYADVGGQPGYALATGAQATIDDTTDGVPTCTTLTDAFPFGEPADPLTAGQTYWAVFRIHNANDAFWQYASQGGGSPRMSTDSGATWGAPSDAANSLLVDSGASCTPDINTNPNPSPDPNAELGDMYAKPGGTSFQTLFASNNGVAQLNLTGGSFSGPNASMMRLFKGEPGGPEGSNFTFPKSLGTGTGGVFLYIVCAPPVGTADGAKTATFTLTSNDPDEGSISWPVWCLVDSTPPSLEFINHPDGRAGWFVTRPAPIQVRGIDPESGNRVKRIFCSDTGGSALDWPNGSFAFFGIQPDGFHTLSCQGTDLANNTSAPGGYTTSLKVDGTPPETTKGGVGPPAISDETAFEFTFTGSDAMSGFQGEFECRLDGAPFEPCTSPASRSGLGNATHTFEVRARDVAGTYDPTPAQWTWEVNAPAPQAGDDVATATANDPIDIDVLANDVDPRGVPIHIVLDAATSERGGAVSVEGSSVRYAPPTGFAGTDRFSYRAVNANGVQSAAATVTVEVAAKNSGKCTVPKVKRGTSFGAAKRKLTAAGCTPGKVRRAHSRKVNRGKLIRMTEKPGTVLEPGAPVGLVLSKGPR